MVQFESFYPAFTRVSFLGTGVNDLEALFSRVVKYSRCSVPYGMRSTLSSKRTWYRTDTRYWYIISILQLFSVEL